MAALVDLEKAQENEKRGILLLLYGLLLYGLALYVPAKKKAMLLKKKKKAMLE